MRLSFFEVDSIVKTFKEVFGVGKIYLFGSRADDTQKGGDIDLFLDVPYSEDTYSKKNVFLIKLAEKIGEQKVDVVFHRDDTRLIEQEIHKYKVELNMDKIVLEKYFQECDKHVQRIEEAYEDIKTKLPLNAQSYELLTKDDVQALDQYIYRFSKLQDTIGDKIFKHIIMFYESNYKVLPFLDLLHLLEKLEYINSAKEWMNLRNTRNKIAHQYENDSFESSSVINDIVAQKEMLVGSYKHIKSKFFTDIK